MNLINHIRAEILTGKDMIPSGTNSPPAEVDLNFGYILPICKILSYCLLSL